MKRIAIIFAVVMAAISCQKPAEEENVQLPVNYNNVSGTWKLDAYDGNSLDEGVFQYINFERKAVENSPFRTFQEYSNIASQYPVKKEGRYLLSETEEGKDVIEGLYPNELSKEWNHKYIIVLLTEEKMVWVAQDDPSVENVYVRAEIPEDILKNFPVEARLKTIALHHS